MPAKAVITPTKKIFSNPFQKKIIEVQDINKTGSLSNRLERPFRFTAHVEYANNSVAAFMDLQNEEEHYRGNLKAAIDSLTPFSLHYAEISTLIEGLHEFHSLLSNLEITDSVDSPVIERIPLIERAYQKYLSIYRRLILNKNSSLYNDSKLNFTLDGLESTLLAPFQRILDYRFFLRKVLRCDQHVCDKKMCAGKLCPTKASLNSRNEMATKQLSQTIKQCYALFDLADNFPGLIEWENKLKNIKCESIGQDNSNMFVDLYLTVPYCGLNQKMAELPQILFSEAFELIPINHEVKTPKKKKDLKIVCLNVFSDFILITEDDGLECQLLFPPMPLSHISVEYRLDMIELKLSPFKMLFLKPCIPSSGSKLSQLYCSILNNPIGSNTSHNLKISDDGNSLQSYEYFKSLCRPFIWKSSAEGVNEFEWCKLSKCDLIVKKIADVFTISLLAEGTARSLLDTRIRADTTFSQVSPKRLQITIVDEDGVKKKLILHVASTQILIELIDVLQNSVQYTVHKEILNSKNLPICDELPSWIAATGCLKVKEIGNHSAIMIQSKLGAWISLGAANSFIILSGPGNECINFRLCVQSKIDPSITFLELDLAKSTWTCRLQGSDMILRIFKHEEDYLDIFFDLLNEGNENFITDLKSLSEEAQFISERLEEQIRQEEMKKIKEHMNQITIQESISLEPKSTTIDKSESSPSIVETIVTEKDEDINELDDSLQLSPNKESDWSNCSEKPTEINNLKSSDSSASLIGNEQKDSLSKYTDVELGMLIRELRSRERETRKLYEQFCSLHDEKKRLLKKSKNII